MLVNVPTIALILYLNRRFTCVKMDCGTDDDVDKRTIVRQKPTQCKTAQMGCFDNKLFSVCQLFAVLFDRSFVGKHFLFKLHVECFFLYCVTHSKTTTKSQSQ